MKIIIATLLLVSGLAMASESNEKDIQCDITKYEYEKEKSQKMGTFQLNDSEKSPDWLKFKMDEKEKLYVACGIVEDYIMKCNAYVSDGKTAVNNKNVLRVGAPILLSFEVGDDVIFNVNCSSIHTMLAWNKRDSVSTTEKPKMRQLTGDELKFCENISNFNKSINIQLINYRTLCVPFLQTLPRALNKSELDHCERDYSIGSFPSWDNRLICTRQITLGTKKK